MIKNSKKSLINDKAAIKNYTKKKISEGILNDEFDFEKEFNDCEGVMRVQDFKKCLFKYDYIDDSGDLEEFIRECDPYLKGEITVKNIERLFSNEILEAKLR